MELQNNKCYTEFNRKISCKAVKEGHCFMEIIEIIGGNYEIISIGKVSDNCDTDA